MGKAKKMHKEMKGRKEVWQVIHDFSYFPNLTIFTYLAYSRRLSGAEIPAWEFQKANPLRLFRDPITVSTQLGPGTRNAGVKDTADRKTAGGAERPPDLHLHSIHCKHSC